MTAGRHPVSRIVWIDRAIIGALPSLRTPRGIAVARAVSALAESTVAGPLVASAALVACRRHGWQAAMLPVLAVPSGVLLRWLLSEAIARPRPPAAVWLAEPRGYSLPSRHTTTAALTTGAVAMAVGAKGISHHAALLTAAAVVGTSRVYLGVHWPSDVLAGWLFAATWLEVMRLAAPGQRGRTVGHREH